MKIIKYFILFVSILINIKPSLAQLDSVYYEGPSTGTVSTGAIQTTDNFGNSLMLPEKQNIIPYLESPTEPSTHLNELPLPPYIYVEDINIPELPDSTNGQTVLLQKFPGHSMTDWIPPDPTIAVGPNHIITCVNSEFDIWDKEGNLLKVIQAEDWWAPVWPEENGDPQVIYDHYAGRWVLSWMQVNLTNLTAGNLIAYSDDDDPLGYWYVYRIDATKHGSITSNTWGDYPQLGFDSEAIYLSTRCFTFVGAYQYNKIRLINKSQLYASNGGQINYTDIWNIRQPSSPSFAPDGIHPSFCYSLGEGGYFFWANQNGGNYYTVYKILNPISLAPRLRGDTLHVQTYHPTPDAHQLEGGMPIESNGSGIKTAPIIRDGRMYVIHSIGNSSNPNYASIKYLIYNLADNIIEEQVEFGAIGYYYIYPTLMVDKDHNIAVTFSRSADTEYIGGYYSSKQATNPPGLSPSQPLVKGLGNYVVTQGTPRNRWGDYLGIYLDPNEYDIWIFPEYSAATNTWGTYVGQIRMSPYQGPHIFTDQEEINFGDIEVGNMSLSDTVIISNYGDSDVIIFDIPSSFGDFNLLTTLTYPYTLSSYDSLSLWFNFSPTDTGQVSFVYPFTSNAPNFSGIIVTGYGILSQTTFPLSVTVNNGWNMVSVPGINPDGQSVDNWWFGRTGEVYKYDGGYQVTTSATPGEGYWMKHVGTNVYNTGDEWPAGGIQTITHDPLTATSGWNLIGGYEQSVLTANITTVPNGLQDGPVYSYSNGYSEATTLDPGYGYWIKLTGAGQIIIPEASLKIRNDDFEWSKEDWGKIILTDASGINYTLYAVTGQVNLDKYELPPMPPAGMFDIRYGSGRIAEDINNSIQEIQMSGVTYPLTVRVEGIDMRLMDETGKTVNVNLESGEEVVISDATIQKLMVAGVMIPAEYALEQNYPNPFNPSTEIEFSIPEAAGVTLTIYNTLGEKIIELVNSKLEAGRFSYQWNAQNVATGMYIYELRTEKFISVKKMILMK